MDLPEPTQAEVDRYWLVHFTDDNFCLDPADKAMLVLRQQKLCKIGVEDVVPGDLLLVEEPDEIIDDLSFIQVVKAVYPPGTIADVSSF